MHIILIIFLILIKTSFSLEKAVIQKKSDHIHIESEIIPDYRKNKKTKHKKIKKEKYYITSEKGKVYHRPSCRFAKKIKYKTKIKSKRSARKKGLRPCKICKP
ncbi:Ada metal-binding domain-containing protein [Persephonella sp.]